MNPINWKLFRLVRASKIQPCNSSACTISISSTAEPTEPFYQVVVEGHIVGVSCVAYLDPNSFALSFQVVPEMVKEPGVFLSLAKVSIQYIGEELAKDDARVVVSDAVRNYFNPSVFGFSKTAGGLELAIDFARAQRTRRVRSALNAFIPASSRVGQGYAIDTTVIGDREGLSQLNADYNAIAWGPASWAKHAVIAPDELCIIDKFVVGKRALEVGAGSGRVSFTVSRIVGHLTATDCVREIVDSLAIDPRLPANVSVMLDDIRSSRLLSDSFDLVLWWENGLGGILDAAERIRALDHVARLLSPGGRLILATRRIGNASIDHLMPTSRCDDVMGVYHTFSNEEILQSIPPKMRVIETVAGDERPAGGMQFFHIVQKLI